MNRELLELAAKAAGYEIVCIASKHIAQGVFDDDLLIRNEQGGDSVWNPRRDDGDALRLAVKLRMSVDVREAAVCVITQSETVILEHAVGEELVAATRLAILRAAAAIGKAMP